jgi:glycosyltransferase involved in cell wall biosynthesis
MNSENNTPLPDVSICLASYNGSKYIADQIKSIIQACDSVENLVWELIVSDDLSTDNTIEIIRPLMPKNGLIISGSNLGISKNFENAILKSRGHFIVLSDQDDVWEIGRISYILDKLKRHDLVVCNLKFVDSKLSPLGFSMWDNITPSSSLALNIFRNRFTGAAMAFKREVFEEIYPFPKGILHDVWIGCASLLLKYRVCFLPGSPILFRRHDNNNSDVGRRQRVLRFRVFSSRIILVFSLFRILISKKSVFR